MKFFSFWRSLASFRVRIALNIKGIAPDEVVNIDLMKGQPARRRLPRGQSADADPALIDNDGKACCSNRWRSSNISTRSIPHPPLLPKDPHGRARVRSLAQIVACDSHPLIVPRVRELSRARVQARRADADGMVPALDHRSLDGARSAARARGRDRPLLPRRYGHASPTFAWSAKRSGRNSSRSTWRRFRRCRASSTTASRSTPLRAHIR